MNSTDTRTKSGRSLLSANPLYPGTSVFRKPKCGRGAGHRSEVSVVSCGGSMVSVGEVQMRVSEEEAVCEGE